MADDRTTFVPGHTGDYILPSTPLFNRLLRFAHDRPPKIAIRDVAANTEADYSQLLTDVVVLRNRLQEHLGAEVLQRLHRNEELYIAVLAAGGYEYTIAMLAIIALGAAVVPLTTALPPKEAFYYATKSNALAVLTSRSATAKGVALETLVKNSDPSSTFTSIPIAPSTFNPKLNPSSITISSNSQLDPNAPGIVIFTSGTTGPPKGSVMRRSYIFDCALGIADHYSITAEDVLLHVLPVHHATGVGIMFFPFLVSGATIEFCSAGFDAAWTWERWRRGGLTFFSGVPTIYMRLMRYFDGCLRDRGDVALYVSAARGLRACICGTSALPKPIADFWTGVLRRKILLRYGGTEFGAVLKVRMGDEEVPDGSVGEVFPGVEMKLSEGDEGEILLKSPYMFSKYLNDAKATAAAHDEQGYYKTGDIARREGKYYWILGRASVDIIKSGGYKISALDIERELLGLPYISEVMIAGVADEEFGQRVAAAIVLKEGLDISETDRGHLLDLNRLRKDLESRLARYKMPTLLRLVEGELPKSATGKVSKKVLGPQLFPEDYRSLQDIQFWDRGLNYNAPKARL